MYETIDKDGKKRPLDYVVWSEVFTCPSCAAPIVFYDAAYNTKTGAVAESFRCESCGAELSKKRLERRTTPVRHVGR